MELWYAGRRTDILASLELGVLLAGEYLERVRTEVVALKTCHESSHTSQIKGALTCAWRMLAETTSLR